MRRWLRCLVCLLVICALLVNLSPLRVKATGVTAGGVAVGVGITFAVAAALNALGVRQGSDSSSFAEVVNSCAEALSPKFAVDGLVTFLSLTQNGVGKTYASANFLQAILDLLYSSGTLIDNSVLPVLGVYTCPFSEKSVEVSGDSPIYAYFHAHKNGSMYQVICDLVSFGSFSYKFSDGVWSTIYPQSSNYDIACLQVSSILLDYIPAGVVDLTNQNYYIAERAFLDSLSTVGSTVTTSQDLTLESVGTDVDTDYKTYVDTGIVDIEWGVHFEENGDGSDDDNNGDGMIGVPVRIPDLSTDSFTDQTQEEAQTGDTPQDVLDQLLQQLGGGGSGSGTGDGTGSGNTGNTGSTWVPPSTHTQFALADLSKYFPFCIPFDLFDFFQLLNADPVAPVLSWEMQDLSGQTYALSVNLSEWDSVAQLFRRLQLFLFICGLAAASRKYIKW